MQKPEKGLQSKSLYAQIHHEIRERILSGELTSGDRLPSELQIAHQHSTSRGVARHALNMLVEEGLLERIQGSGTFVRHSSLTRTRNTSLSAQRSIGVILSEASDELNIDVLRGIEQAAKPRGYQLNFTFAEEDVQEFAQDIARLKASGDGLIIWPISNISHDETIAQLQRDNFPFVLVDRYISDLDCDYVTSDNFEGGYRATEHLLILGHTRIGFVYSPTGGLLTTSVHDRLRGYRQALQEYNQPYDESLIYQVSSKIRETSIISYDALVTHPNRPNAFFAASDSIAVQILAAAQRHALRVPEDIAMVGFDNMNYSPLLSVPLTTVAQQSTEIGLRAGSLLINCIERQGNGAPKHIELPTSLIIRQSCGARLRVSNSQ